MEEGREGERKGRKGGREGGGREGEGEREVGREEEGGREIYTVDTSVDLQCSLYMTQKPYISSHHSHRLVENTQRYTVCVKKKLPIPFTVRPF